MNITADQQRRLAVSVLSGAGLAYYWKAHRVWGFVLGFALSGWAYTLVSPQTAPLFGSPGDTLGPLQSNS